MAYRKEPEGLISRGEILALAAPIQTAMDTEDSPQIRSHLESLLNYLKHVVPKE
jgi:hypothetical protein